MHQKELVRKSRKGEFLTSLFSLDELLEGYSAHVMDGRANNAYSEMKIKFIKGIKEDFPKYKITTIDIDNAYLIIKSELFINEFNRFNSFIRAYHDGECSLDATQKYLNEILKEHEKERAELINGYHVISLRIAYFSFGLCSGRMLPISLFGPLGITIANHMINNEDERGIEIYQLFYTAIWQIASNIVIDDEIPSLVSRDIGRQGGRPEHPRKNEAITLANKFLLGNKSLSICDVAEDIFIEFKKKYNDYPKLPTIRKWLNNINKQ